MRTRWSPKDPVEKLIVTFDFDLALNDNETIIAAEVSSALQAGVDEAPQDVLSGEPSITGGSVLQAINGGAPGASYTVRCVVTLSTSRVLALAATLPIRRA